VLEGNRARNGRSTERAAMKSMVGELIVMEVILFGTPHFPDVEMVRGYVQSRVASESGFVIDTLL
jgi:hypothetical protein